ncbi:GntR family transcriptional regulator [Pseudooceanicola nanhaiensis]|uniref:GntR family transcriptional regulator n=1 Tax=Pseudooceanicola nanhaiensis TaxID=375761 RepID=UPI004059CCA4
MSVARASETVRKKLEREINAGILRPGDSIDEKSLAARFEVSRTPAREAIMQLAASGLVEIRPRHGAVVVSLDAAEAVAMMETLAILEAEAAALAAQRMPEHEVAVMLSIYEDSQSSAASLDSDAYIELNTRFHRTIYDGARNEYLGQMIRQTRKRMAFYHSSSLYQKARLERSWQEHGNVVHAIRDGDADRAREAMRDHILSGGRVYADLVAALKKTERAPTES